MKINKKDLVSLLMSQVAQADLRAEEKEELRFQFEEKKDMKRAKVYEAQGFREEIKSLDLRCILADVFDVESYEFSTYPPLDIERRGGKNEKIW